MPTLWAHLGLGTKSLGLATDLVNASGMPASRSIPKATRTTCINLTQNGDGAGAGGGGGGGSGGGSVGVGVGVGVYVPSTAP